LNEAKAKVPTGSFDLAPLDSLSFPDASFDMVVRSLAITHEANPTPAIRELARVARPGGHVVVSDVHPMMVGLGMHAFYTGADGQSGIVRNHLHLPSTYLSAFREAGLDVVDCLEPLWNTEEALKVPWVGARPDLWKATLADLPVVIVWETVRRA
jgi:SAM-dependent methyltransferase